MHVPGWDPVHTPLTQVYVRHLFDPLQDPPSLAGGLEQSPVPGSHVPTPWQPSLAVQVTEFVPVHTPLTHA